MFDVLWTVVTFPFRAIGWAVELLGRIVGVVLGFALMVAGIAFCSGSLLLLGIPLFLVGLLLMLRSLG